MTGWCKTPMPVLEQAGMEFHQQSDAYRAHAQVGQEPRIVGREQGGRGFDLRNDRTVDRDTGRKSARDGGVLVCEWQGGFGFQRETGSRELQAQALRVDRPKCG